MEVIGFGMAGACVALQLQRGGHEVRVVDDGEPGSSQVAAGLVNPVGGRNFEPSVEVEEAWAVARSFYDELGAGLFRQVPILRLWRGEKDREKFERKRGRVERWIEKVDEEGVTWKEGGWLDCPAFLAAAKGAFLERGGEVSGQARGGVQVWCSGAAGLLRGDFTGVTHRSAKGEILTVRVPGWDEKRILTGGGWVIPIGDDCYRVGATYEWENLSAGCTAEGRTKVENLLRIFTKKDYEVIEHVSGIRPIIHRSQPVIHHEKGKGWMVNGLGSKGVIYAPRLGRELLQRLDGELGFS